MARVIITDLSEETIARYGGWNVVTPAPGRRAAAAGRTPVDPARPDRADRADRANEAPGSTVRPSDPSPTDSTNTRDEGG